MINRRESKSVLVMKNTQSPKYHKINPVSSLIRNQTRQKSLIRHLNKSNYKDNNIVYPKPNILKFNTFSKLKLNLDNTYIAERRNTDSMKKESSGIQNGNPYDDLREKKIKSSTILSPLRFSPQINRELNVLNSSKREHTNSEINKSCHLFVKELKLNNSNLLFSF